MNVFRLGTPALRQGLGVRAWGSAQGLGGFAGKPVAVKTSVFLEPYPASGHGITGKLWSTLLLPKWTCLKTAFKSSSQAQGQYLESMAMMRILTVNRDPEVFTSISVTFPFLNIFAVNIFFFMKIFYSLLQILL